MFELLPSDKKSSIKLPAADLLDDPKASPVEFSNVCDALSSI